MATAVSAGWPLFLDGMSLNGQLARQFDSGVSVYDNGTASSALPGGGVIDGSFASLAVTAPASGLTVNVAPGYAIVPATTAHNGAYRFGLMQSGILTVASNGTGATRQDYVVASVTDLGSSSSTCQVAYITGTTVVPALPSNAILLAQVAVPTGASSITTAMITDKRAFVAAPGGIIPIASASTAPGVPGRTFLWNYGTGRLVQGTGTAGTVQAWAASPGTTYYAGPNGTHGTSTWTFNDNFFGGGSQTALSLTITADGVTDFEVAYFAASIKASSGSPQGSMALAILVDGSQRDATYVDLSSSTAHGLSGGATWYTSGAQGTTMSAGQHTVSLALIPDFTSGGFTQSQVIAPLFLHIRPTRALAA